MSELVKPQKSGSNPMQAPRIDKVVINIAVGQSGEPLQKAMTVLEQLTGKKPCQRLARKTIKDWGVRKNEPIACIITLRKQAAKDFLIKAFESVGNKLPISNFDRQGNFAFGIEKHIDLPGTKYDPKLGIFGMDVCVSIEKPSYSIKKKKGLKSIGKKQRVTPEEAVKFIRDKFRIEIIE
ncbi:50S ribosomal protein L5 [Candidatus Bathyarchaeota archaeon]|nr:50S ribosomal protein L5 [Candidatus Bathyarchaeota archaeon]